MAFWSLMTHFSSFELGARAYSPFLAPFWCIGAGSFWSLLYSLWFTVDMVWWDSYCWWEPYLWWLAFDLPHRDLLCCDLFMNEHFVILNVTHVLGRHSRFPLILKRISRTGFFLPEKKYVPTIKVYLQSSLHMGQP